MKFEDYSSESKSGNIEVSYERTDCCSDTSGWISSNLSILEPSSCSVRVCKEGKPAQWDRKYVSKGLVRSIFSIWSVTFNIDWDLETNFDSFNLTDLFSSCGCCEHNNMLIMPGELVQLPGGKIVKCCDGELAEDLVKGEALFIFSKCIYFF